MYELIRHNVGDNRSTTIEENIAEIKPITIAFTHDIEMEKKYFGNREEWKPYLEEPTIRVKFDMKPEVTPNRGNCRAKAMPQPRQHCGCPNG